MYCTVVVVPYCTYLAKLVALGHILENPFARFLIGPLQVEGGVSQAPAPSVVFFSSSSLFSLSRYPMKARLARSSSLALCDLNCLLMYGPKFSFLVLEY